MKEIVREYVKVAFKLKCLLERMSNEEKEVMELLSRKGENLIDKNLLENKNIQKALKLKKEYENKILLIETLGIVNSDVRILEKLETTNGVHYLIGYEFETNGVYYMNNKVEIFDEFILNDDNNDKNVDNDKNIELDTNRLDYEELELLAGNWQGTMTLANFENL